jgi:poly(hydroxyalkanoate) depolymerase family esterase
MKISPAPDAAEAVRLTREGRLAEAMAVLRRAIPAPPPGPKGGSHALIPPTLQGVLDRVGQILAPGAFGASPPHHAERASIKTDARFAERRFANAAGSRVYKLYVPGVYTGQKLPLIVMLHGCTQSPDDFAAGTRMNDLAEAQGFFVAYPEQPRSANASKCWNWFSEGDQHRDRGEPSLIAGITRAIMDDFAVDPGRVFIAGLSAGGAAAAVMGAAYPDLYAAIGVHSGLACGAATDISSALTAMRQGGPAPRARPAAAVPTIVFHGDRDTTVNRINGDRVIAQARSDARLRATIIRSASPGGVKYTRTIQADQTGRPILEQWLLHGAGHAWSGGSPAGSYTDPRGPDASAEMARFFLEQGAKRQTRA